jgi:hypothetical protein
MCRLLFLLLATTTLLLAATAPEKTAVLGKVQPEIRLTDGTIFKKAKIVDFSMEKSTATIADPTRIRVVPLDTLPPKLRHQLLSEAGIKSDDTSTPPKRATTRPTRPHHAVAPAPPPPPDKTILPDPPAASSALTPPAPLDRLLQQAATAAPDELKFYLARAFDRVGSLTCKIRETIQVPGWQKIRVSGEAAFTQWDARQNDHVWRTDKFEVEFAILEGRTLRPDTVSFGGLSRPVGGK